MVSFKCVAFVEKYFCVGVNICLLSAYQLISQIYLNQQIYVSFIRIYTYVNTFFVDVNESKTSTLKYLLTNYVLRNTSRGYLACNYFYNDNFFLE